VDAGAGVAVVAAITNAGEAEKIADTPRVEPELALGRGARVLQLRECDRREKDATSERTAYLVDDAAELVRLA
jgi:hypothetical protein